MAFSWMFYFHPRCDFCRGSLSFNDDHPKNRPRDNESTGSWRLCGKTLQPSPRSSPGEGDHHLPVAGRRRCLVTAGHRFEFGCATVFMCHPNIGQQMDLWKVVYHDPTCGLYMEQQLLNMLDGACCFPSK